MSIASELKEIAKELQAELKDLDKFTELDTWFRLEDIQRRLDKCYLETMNNDSVKNLAIAYDEANFELAEEGRCDCPTCICLYCGQGQKQQYVRIIDEDDF